MKRMTKYAAMAGLAGALSLGMVMPSQAAQGRNAAAAIGFGAGALVGMAATNHHGYEGPSPDYAPAYQRTYSGYAPSAAHNGAYGAYDYQPASSAYDYAPAAIYRSGSTPSCASPGMYGRTSYKACYD